MDRIDKALTHVDKSRRGLEIGPSHNPMAPRRDGYDVDVVDYLDRDGLVAKYADDGVDLEAIEEVDFVWTGQTYAELTGGRRYGWIIASHVVEHVPDLVGFLDSCASVLEDDGVLSLVVPDKRYCFDHFRPLTGLSQVIDAHLEGRRITSPGAVAEYHLDVVRRGGEIAWEAGMTDERFEFVHTWDEAVATMAAVRDRATYVDLHSWCFVPTSFRLILDDLHRLGFTSLREVDASPTAGSEFFVTLGPAGSGVPFERLEAHRRIQEELHEPATGALALRVREHEERIAAMEASRFWRARERLLALRGRGAGGRRSI